MESNLFSAEGRIRRSTYWARVIVATAIQILAKFMAESDSSTAILCLIVILITGIFSIFQGVKRMHDLGKSGWYIIIPIYNLILTFTDGTRGDNEYGENPKEKNTQEDELYNGIITLLFSAFVTCGIYALLTITKIINDETAKNSIFIISFTACNLYFLTWYISKTEKRNSIESGQ
jgi:uncharacterized membrane protein YhaH (DUF805 family)